MNVWPDNDGAAIELYVRQMGFRHSKTGVIYRSELLRFQWFIACRSAGPVLAVEDLAAWLRDRAVHWPPFLVLDRARKVDRFLSFLVARGLLTSQPFETLRNDYGVRTIAQIVPALLTAEPMAAFESLRRSAKYSSFLGPLMRDHVAIMRSMGYRFDTQSARFETFDRFLQSRPDLTGQALPVLVREWAALASTTQQRWRCYQLGRDLTKAWRRIDPTMHGIETDRDLRRHVDLQQRRPYLYTPAEVRLLLDTARSLPAPRAPLRPLTAYTMLVFAYCAGLRLGEIVRLDIGDVHFDDGTIDIRNTKFFKSRRLPLSDSTLVALREYLQARADVGGHQEPTAALFWRQTRQGGGRYSHFTIWSLLVRVLRRSGLKPAHGRHGPRIHDLRHAFVCHRMLQWYREGVEPQARLPYLATYLGHKDINSTLIYLTVTQELLQIAGERFRSYVHGAIAAAPGRQS